MKEEKWFVPAINNNEIHPVDMLGERYYYPPFLSLLNPLDNILVFSPRFILARLPLFFFIAK